MRRLAAALGLALAGGDDAFHARLDFLRSEGGLFRDVALIEAEAAKFHDRLQARYGKRLRLPATPEQLVASWPRLFGERFEERREHRPLVVIVDTPRPQPQLRRVRHVLAARALDLSAGAMGFPDDDATVNAGARHAEGAHRPLLAALFANETWGGRFDWLAFGAVDAAAAARFLAARDAALTWFLGAPGPGAVCRRDRSADPFACCASDAAPCAVDVPPRKPYFSFEVNGSRLRPAPCRRYRNDGRYASFSFKPCCPVSAAASRKRRLANAYRRAGGLGRAQVRQRRRVDSDATGFPYRYQPRRGRVHFHALAFDVDVPYFVSRGLLDRAAYRWRACADKLACGAAGKRFATCAFNLGAHLSQLSDPRKLMSLS